MGNYNCSLYVLWIATLSMVVLWYAYDSPTSRLYVGYTTTIGLQEHYESATSRLYVGYNRTTGALVLRFGHGHFTIPLSLTSSFLIRAGSPFLRYDVIPVSTRRFPIVAVLG